MEFLISLICIFKLKFLSIINLLGSKQKALMSESERDQDKRSENIELDAHEIDITDTQNCK